jgi:hypothetical protein
MYLLYISILRILLKKEFYFEAISLSTNIQKQNYY